MELSPDIQANGDEMREEYDLNALSNAVQGKYAHRMKAIRKNVSTDYEHTSSLSQSEQNKSNALKLTICEKMLPILERVVVPILRYRDDSLQMHGTGTLFRIADKSFLVTASHVLKHAIDNGYSLAISDFGDGVRAVGLEGKNYSDNDEDIAVLELSQDVVSQIPNRRFLTIHHTDRNNDRPRNGEFMLCGYPIVLSKTTTTDLGNRKMRSYPLTSFAGIYSGETSHLSDYDTQAHLLLSTPYEDAELLAEAEVPIPSRVHGMSGCSIWQVFYNGLSPEHWTTDDAVIVGIQTGVYTNGDVTKGTRWSIIFQFLRDKFPELRGPLSLVMA